MNKAAIIIIQIILGIQLNAQPNSACAKAFHQAISGGFDLIDIEMQAFNRALISTDGDQILVAYDRLIKTTESVIESGKAMKVCPGAEAYHLAATELCNFYLSIFENEYHTVVALLFKMEITDEDFQVMEQIFDDIETREAVFLEKFTQVQQEFCTTHGINEE